HPPRPPLFPYTTLFRSHRAAQPIESLVDEDEWIDAAAPVHVLHAQVHAVNSTGTQLAYVAFARHGTIKPVYDERGPVACGRTIRSEEHTSELQSRFDLV